MEQPVLRLGLLGFPEAVGQRLQGWAEQTQHGWPRWRLSDPHLADAWMIRGAAVEVLGRDAVVIHHPHGSGERLTLNRAEVDRPLAFATPLPEGFASAEYFGADDEKSVRHRLQRFEAWLRPLRSQFALGAQLVERIGQYKGGVVHVTHDSKLMAVIDFDRWLAGLHIPARPVDMAMAEWFRRPALANDIPASFMRLPLHRVMWTYAERTLRDVLPARYREKTIYLRRIPSMPVRWFDDLHLRIMRELMMKPVTLDVLQERTSMPATDLAHHMASLFFAGAVTTDPDSARRAEPKVRRQLVALHLDQATPDAEMLARTGNSELSAPSSILREVPSSPLRGARGESPAPAVSGPDTGG